MAVRWGHSRLPVASGPCKRPGAHAGSDWGCSHAHVRVDALLQKGGLWPQRMVRHQVLEPFWALDARSSRLSWTHALKGRTVLVVHGFAATIAAQTTRVSMADVWGEAGARVFPRASLKLVKAPMNVGASAGVEPRRHRIPHCHAPSLGQTSWWLLDARPS